MLISILTILSIKALPLLLMFGIGLVVCSSECGDQTFPDPYIEAASEGNPCPEDVFPVCCTSGIAFIMCDTAAVPDTLEDTAVIEALKTAGKILTYKNVYVKRNPPTPIIQVFGCPNKNILVGQEELIDVEIADGSVTHADEFHMNLLYGLNNKFGLAMQTSDNYTYIAPDWIAAYDLSATLPTTQMGIEATFTIPPYKTEYSETEICRWKMQFKIKYRGVLKGSLITGWIGGM